MKCILHKYGKLKPLTLFCTLKNLMQHAILSSVLLHRFLHPSLICVIKIISYVCTRCIWIGDLTWKESNLHEKIIWKYRIVVFSYEFIRFIFNYMTYIISNWIDMEHPSTTGAFDTRWYSLLETRNSKEFYSW